VVLKELVPNWQGHGRYVYTDNETGELQDLSYDDFVVGDKITVDIKSVENTCCITSRVQLITQRK